MRKTLIATGASHAYFGHDDWMPFAPGLKSLDDATAIRRRILLAFEKAETSNDPREQRRLGNFVIIGGGPTGVELSGAIAELAKKALVRDFRNIDSRHARIILVEAGPRLLAAFPEKLSARAKRSLEHLGVEVRLGSPVTSCDANGLTTGEGRIDAGTIIWAAGVAASPAAVWLGSDKDRAGRVILSADFSLPQHPEIFVIGDTASAKDRAGSRCQGWRRLRSKKRITSPRLSRRGSWAISHLALSFTKILANLPPSAAALPSSISVGCK